MADNLSAIFYLNFLWAGIGADVTTQIFNGIDQELDDEFWIMNVCAWILLDVLIIEGGLKQAWGPCCIRFAICTGEVGIYMGVVCNCAAVCLSICLDLDKECFGECIHFTFDAFAYISITVIVNRAFANGCWV